MASANLFMDIIARDRASSVFNSIGKSAAGMGKGVDRAAKSSSMFGRATKAAFGMVSAYSIGRFLSSSVKEYAQAELAQNKLENAYARFPKMAQVNIQAFRDLNTAMMQKTRFDDDSAAAMQANLARYDLTGQQILKLTPLVADLAEATGTDLVSAGSALGKSFLGNTRALKALGINYTATGNRAKDMRNIIDLVNKKVGGEATKAGETTAVKMERLKNTFGELKETVGQAVLPAFTKLVDVAGPAIEKLGGWVDRNMDDIEEGFRKAFRAAEKVGGAVKGVWDAFSGLPPEAQKLILAMAGGTWAVGKIKNSAFSSGIGALFKGVKTITAGNVTVVGKTVTGGGVGGGKGGPGLLATVALNPLTIAALITGIAFTVNARNRENDPRSPLPAPPPGGPPGLTGFPQVSDANRASDEARRWNKAAEALRNYTAAVDQATAADRNNRKGLNDRGQTLKEGMREYKRNVDQATAADRNRRKGLDDLGKSTDTAKSKTKGLGTEVGRLKSKKVKVEEDGADKSKGRVKGLGAAVGALKGKRVKVEEDGANDSSGRVRGLKVQIGGLKGKSVKIDTQTQNASTAIFRLMGQLANIPRTIPVNVQVTRGSAAGGYISGPGTSTSDSIPARLSNGEYVIRASAVQRYGVDFFNAANAMRLSGFANGGKAKKNPVQQEMRQSQREARRQQRIAGAVSRRGLSDDVINFLSGMSSQAALKMLRKSDSRLNTLAAQANAVTNFQTNRQNAAQAAADAQEAATQAAKDAADAQAAAQDAALDKVNQLRDAVDGLAGSYRSFAGIGTTSVMDVSEAQAKLSDANQAVIDAQKAVDIAGSDRERALASARLAEALKAQASAQQNVNTAGKPTTASIRGNMANKLQRLKDFASAVKRLKANGLNPVTLAELLQMGPEQGYEFAQALLSGGLADINSLQNQITATAADLGYFQYGIDAASASVTGSAAANAAGLVTNGIVMAPAPVTISIDGNAIANALISYKRQNGGAIPGLAV